jgi:hypothetical protein
VLTKIIPDTIKDDSDEQELTELENQLKSFERAEAGEEKGQIYAKYNHIINEVLTEIRQEKARYQQTKSGISGANEVNNKTEGLPAWAWIGIIAGIIAVGGIVFYYFFVRKNGKKRSKT